LKTQLLLEEREKFDRQIFDCVDRALSTLGLAQKEFALGELGRLYHLSARNFAKEPLKLEEGLRRILGDFVTASVLDSTIGNISESFGINCDGCSNLSKIIEHLERKKESSSLMLK